MLLKVYKSRVWMLLFMLMPFVGNAQIPGLPPGWDFTLNPTSATYAIPVDVPFNGVDALAPGDWIGVFYNDNGTMECGGAVQWDGTNNVAIVAFGNDTLVAPDKNGFSEGEEVMWKFYYEATMTETEVCTMPTFFWTNGDLAEVDEFMSCGCVQTVDYVTGWNWISFNALPASPTAANVLADFTPQSGDIIKTQSGSAFFTGAAWFPPTFTINADNAYLLKTSGPSGSFDVTGDCIDVQDPINIVTGWNWISYKPSAPLTPAVALASIAPFAAQDIVKTQSGSAFYTGATWFPPSFTMNPGLGYKMKYQNAANTLIYPETDATSASGPTTSKIMKGDPGWTPTPGLETNMNVFVDDAAVNGVSVMNGKVATFDVLTDQCRGVADFFSGDAFLTVGFNSEEEGNEFYYLVWDSDVDIIYEVEESDVYVSDAFITRNLTLVPPITVNTISGTITDAVTGDPLEGVEVTATPGTDVIDGDPGWTPTPGLETNMNVFVDDAAVNGTSVLNGKVATFDVLTDQCRGVAEFFSGDAFLTVGFNSEEEGNEFYYLVWDSDADVVYEVEETDVYVSDAFITRNLTLIPGITPLVTYTAADGTYMFDDVPDGTWTVCTGQTDPTEGYIDECAEPVTVPPSQVVDFALQPEITCEDAVINNFPEFQEDVCEGTELVIDFSGVEILNAETIEWLVDPAVAGEYIGTDFVLNTTYVGPVTLTLNAYAFEPCLDATASLEFTVNPLPEVTCPADFAVCEDAGVIVLADLGAEPAGGTFYDLGGNMFTEFDPAIGAGDYTFIYEYTDANGCTNSCQFVITVNALPIVTIEAYEPVCVGSGMFDLYGGMPVGGTYYVDGVEATTFDPMFAGTYVIEYCYTDVNGCAACATTELIVNDLPEVFCPEDIETCVTTPAFMLTGATPEGGDYSGMGVTDNMFDPAVAGVGMWDITYMYTDANGCSNECGFMITVLPAPEVYAGMDATIAEDDTYTLAGATAANVDDINWSTSGDGTFDDQTMLNATYTPGPDDIAIGVVTLSIVGVGPCGTAEDSMMLTIVGGGCINPPTAFAGDDAAICEGGDFMLMDATATNYASLMWTTSGDGMFDDATAMNPVYMPGPNDVVNGMAEICLTAEPSDPNCQAVTDCMMLTINMLPDVQCPEDFAVCIDADPWMLYGATPEGGEYTGEGVVDGMFDPALVGEGIYEITYTYEDMNGCVNFCMFNITVNPLPEVTLEAFEPVCAGTLPFELFGGMPTGGTYYINGVETTVFDPAVAGTYTVEYVYTDENGCTNSAMGELVVNPTPEVTLVAYEPVCEGTEAFDLYGGLPEGGSYFVDGVPATTFDPAFAGTYVIGYEYTNEFGCIGYAETELVVNPAPVAICEDIEVCENGDVIEFMPGEFDEYMYDGMVITSFDPAMYGPGVYEITFIAGNEFGCTDMCMFTITVLPIPVIVEQPMDVEVIYGDNAEFMVVAENAEGYQWYSPDGMIVGANTDMLIIEGVTTADAGEYYVEVSNECATMMSEMAVLTVLPWTQVIDFGGPANGMSTYLELINDDIAYNMNPIDDILQSVEFMRPNMVYVPGGPSFAWNEAKGAKTILEEGWPTSIEVVGYPTLGTTIEIPSGWSLIPVWSYGVVEASDIFDQLGADLVAAFSIDYAGMYWPAYNIYTLQYLVPGSAYLVAVNNGPKTIDFDVPIVDATPGYASLPPNITSWNNVNMTGVQHNIAITSEALADLQVGDVIGAFNQNGAIAGMVEVTSTRDNIALRIYGDNTATQKADGFIDGDLLTFKVYRDGMEMDVLPTFDPNMPNTNVFAENGLSAITDLKAGTTSVNDPSASLTATLYPNPANDIVNIATNFQISNLKVVNYVGQVVYDRSVDQMEIQVNTSNFGPGMYFVQIESVDGIVITKRLTVN